jgi:hypothetical protein
MIEEIGQNLIEKMEEFARKMKDAEIMFCSEHQLEFPNFEKCPDCEHEAHEFKDEMSTKTKGFGLEHLTI